ncbi:MAG: glycosyltransferase family 4 protein [bacterium]|nr:glycosyltransferase family 4 protein [bacterium]
MRILFSNASLMWGGNEKWTLNAAETLAARGHDVSVAVREKKLWIERRKSDLVTWIELPFLNDADLRTILKLRGIIKKEKIDIFLPTRSRDYWLGGWAAMGTDAKYVMRMGITRTLPNTIKERLRYSIWPDGIIVNAEAVKQSLIAHPWIKGERIRVIYNGVDSDSIQIAERGLRTKSGSPPESGILVIAAGRVESEKGFDVLIDAMALAVKQEPRLICEIWGNGDQIDSLNAQIERLELDEHVRLRGFTQNLSHELARADVAVSSSYREGISNFILESWSAGVPLVATSIEGSAEIVHDRKRGLLVPPGDAQTMSKAILELVKDKQLRDTCIAGGKQAIATTHNWTAMAEKMENFFRELTNK